MVRLVALFSFLMYGAGVLWLVFCFVCDYMLKILGVDACRAGFFFKN